MKKFYLLSILFLIICACKEIELNEDIITKNTWSSVNTNMFLKFEKGGNGSIQYYNYNGNPNRDAEVKFQKILPLKWLIKKTKSGAELLFNSDSLIDNYSHTKIEFKCRLSEDMNLFISPEMIDTQFVVRDSKAAEKKKRYEILTSKSWKCIKNYRGEKIIENKYKNDYLFRKDSSCIFGNFNYIWSLEGEEGINIKIIYDLESFNKWGTCWWYYLEKITDNEIIFKDLTNSGTKYYIKNVYELIPK